MSERRGQEWAPNTPMPTPVDHAEPQIPPSFPVQIIVDSRLPAEIVNLLEEHERIDALRPPCPTCDGESIVARPPNNVIASACAPCPDCADGRMSWERMTAIVARLAQNPEARIGPVAFDGFIGVYPHVGQFMQSVRP